MEKEAFEASLRTFLHREPFEPFVVELASGEQMTVTQPNVVFDDGFASYWRPDDGGLWDFSCEEVRQMRPVAKEPV